MFILETWRLVAEPLPDYPDDGQYNMMCMQVFKDDEAFKAYDLYKELQARNNRNFRYILRIVRKDGEEVF